MLEEMPATLMAEWQEFFRLEPWGFEVEDSRSALVSSTVARAAGAKVKFEDFSMKPPPPPLTAEELDAKAHAELVESIKRTLGGQHIDEAPASTPKGKL